MDQLRFQYNKWEINTTSFSEDPQQVPAEIMMRSSFQRSLSSPERHSSPSFFFPCGSSSTSQVAGYAERYSNKVHSWNFGNSSTERPLMVDADSSPPHHSLLFSEQISPTSYGGATNSIKDIRNYGAVLQERSLMAVETRGPLSSTAQEHTIAERKRREKMNQNLIELAATIPGLKKADKASVLGDAVKYVKELQAKLKSLEDQSMERTVESVVLVKKSRLSTVDDGSLSGENLDLKLSESSFPEIEAKLSSKSILVRIHCENKKGVLVKTLTELEKLHLTITNINVMPFMRSSINITIMAQIEEEFSMTAKDLVSKLQEAMN